MKWVATAALLLFFCPCASGQIFNIAAGDGGNLFNSAGVTATAYFQNGSTTAVSAGEFSGRFIGGATESFAWRDWNIVAGDSQVSLLTDGGGVSAQLIGTTLFRRERNRKLTFFAGAISDAYTAPYVFGSVPQHFGVGASFEQTFRRVIIKSLVVQSANQKSILQSATFAKSWLTLSATGGILQNSPLWNGSANIHFSHFGASVNDTTMLLPVRADATSESVYGTLGIVSGQAMQVQSRGGGLRDIGQMYGTAFRLLDNKVTIQTNWYSARSASGRSSSLNTTATEHWRRYLVSETVSRGGGQTSFSMGGGYTGNGFSVSVGHQTLYFPLLSRPWQQTLSISVSLHWRNASATISTVAMPNGGLKWGVFGSSYLYRDQAPPGGQEPSIGKFTLSGTIVDESGAPVSGGAVRIGKDVVFSGDDGTFALRARKRQPCPFAVLPDDFLLGNWATVTAPTSIEVGKPISVIVRAVSAKI